MQWCNTIATPSKPQKNFTVLQLNGPQQSTFCSSHTSNLLLSDPRSQWSTTRAWGLKGNKLLLVGLNLFYMERSLQGSADQKAENYCVICGSWKHSRDAARDVPHQLVLLLHPCKWKQNHITVRNDSQLDLKQNSAHKSSQSTIQVLLFFYRSSPVNHRIETKIQQRISAENFRYLGHSLHPASLYPT